MKQKPKAEFTFSDARKVEILLFNNKGITGMDLKEVTGKTDNQIYNLMLSGETVKIESKKSLVNNGPFKKLLFFINELEVISDNRSLFGHVDQKTEKLIKRGHNIFVAGQFATLKDFVDNGHFEKLNIQGQGRFISFLRDEYDLTNYDACEDLDQEREDIKFVFVIQGEGGEYSIYEKFEEGDEMKPFDL